LAKKKGRKRRQKVRKPKLGVQAPGAVTPAQPTPKPFEPEVLPAIEGEPRAPVELKPLEPQVITAPLAPPVEKTPLACPIRAGFKTWFISSISIYSVILLTLVAFMFYVRVNFSYDVVVNTFPEINFAQDDAVYHMRLINHAVENWPHFLLYDAYTVFPYGSSTHFGPFFTLLVATAAEVIGLGSPSQQLVDMVGALSPAVFACLCAVPVYYIGKLAYNRRVGILAALLFAVIPGQFVLRGLIGFTDHDMAALLFILISTALTLKAILLGRDVFNPHVEEEQRRHKDKKKQEPAADIPRIPGMFTVFKDLLRGIPANLRTTGWLVRNPLGWVFVFAAVLTVFAALAGGYVVAAIPTLVVLALIAAASETAGPLRNTLIYSTLAGLAFGSFMLVWTGAFFFELIILVFILFQAVLDVWRGHDPRYLFWPVALLFAVPMAFVPFFIDTSLGLQLGFYSIAQPVFLLVGLMAVAGIWLAWWASSRLPITRKLGYPVTLIVLAVAGLALIAVVSPGIMTAIEGAFGIFTPTGGGTTVAEMASVYYDRSTGQLSLTPALQNFGVLYFVSLVGMAMLFWRILKHRLPADMLLMAFSVLFFIAMYSQSRFSIFFAASVALLSALVFERGLQVMGISRLSAGYQSKADTRENADRFLSHNGKTVAYCLVFVLLLFFIALPGINGQPQRQGDIPGVFYFATDQYFGVDDQWYDALNWMNNSTPPLSLDYYQRYYEAPPAGEHYDYPPEDYAVMSWWDYGHVITYWAHRIPNANPFQSGIMFSNESGDFGAAYYFTSTDEQEANNMLDMLGSRFVVSDDQMAGVHYNDKFSAMVVWANNTYDNGTAIEYYTPTIDVIGGYPYPRAEYADDDYFWWDGYRYRTQTYWETMQASLHYFDGSGMRFTGDEVMLATNNYYGVQDQGTGQYNNFLVKYKFSQGQEIPALEHYRLVYESPKFTGGLAYLYHPGDATSRNYSQLVWVDSYTYGDRQYYAFMDPAWTVHVVKIWEYVPGVTIIGTAEPDAELSLEITVQTNAPSPSVNVTTDMLEETNRTFTYRAWATAGADGNFEFVVPYPTGPMQGDGYQYDVVALGPYFISDGQTTYEVHVTEEQIMEGATIRL